MRWLQTLDNYNIPVLFGTGGMAYLATRLCGAVMHWSWWVVLCLTVWVIYTIVHLRDARGTKNLVTGDRHYFHQQNFLFLSRLTGVVIVVCAVVSLLYLPQVIFYCGIAIFSLCVLYVKFIATGASHFIKEVVIAFLFMIGIWYGPVLQAIALKPDLWLASTAVFLIALSNLLMLSLSDSQYDSKQGFKSIMTHYTNFQVKIFIHIALACGCILAVAGMIYNIDTFFRLIAFVVLLLIQLVMLAMALKLELFAGRLVFRILLDILLSLPFILVIIN